MDQHKAIFMGEKVRLEYYCNNGYLSSCEYYNIMPYIGKFYAHIEDVKIAEGMLDFPPLKVDSFVFVNELNQKLKVKDVIRSTNNEFIYFLDYHAETVEDETTKESKKKAEDELPDIIKKFNEKRIERSKSTKRKYKKWYQFWK